MRIGANTLIWTAGFGREHIPLLAEIKEHGFDLVELARFDWTDYPAAEIRRALEKLDLGVSYCTAFGSPDKSLVHEDAAARRAGIDFMKQAIDNTAATGGQMLAGPFHSPVGYLPGRRRTADEWTWEVEALSELGEYAAKSDVTVAVEPLNRFESYFLNTAADGARLCEEVNHPNVGLLYDTFHAHIEEKDQGDAIRTAGRHIKHFHSCENDRGTPGSGQVHWPPVFAALRDVDYCGALVIESFGYAIKELAKAACIWRDLASSPDAIAWDGIKFLRSQTR
jgi:D-psicose/D-tagatose/L-ribulose 3-epimerase